MNNTIITIVKKELLRFFCDKRLIFSVIIFPGLLIYVMYTIMGNALGNMMNENEAQNAVICTVGMPSGAKQLFQKQKLKCKSVARTEVANEKKKVRDEKTDLILVFPDNFEKDVAAYDIASGKKAPNIEIYFNSSNECSVNAYQAVTECLDAVESSMVNKFDINADGAKYDLVNKKNGLGSMFAGLLSMLILIFVYSGCVAVAPDAIAGEKERGTMATLLVTPAGRGQIAIGKILALSIMALLSGASSTIGSILSLPKMVRLNGGWKAQAYQLTDYLWITLLILSSVLLLISIISVISAYAHTVKEAQSLVLPLMVIVMVIGFSSMYAKDAVKALYYYLIPCYNIVQSMLGIFSFHTNVMHVLITIGINLAYTGLAVACLMKMFQSEKIVFDK